MALPPAETFDYIVRIPRPRGSACIAETRGARAPLWARDATLQRRLLGYNPAVRIADDRITLTARGRWRGLAAARAASLPVHPNIAQLLAPGDALHLVRTSSAGLAVSLLRAGVLVVAFGAVTQVTLGADVAVRLVPTSDATEELSVELAAHGALCRLAGAQTLRLGAYDVHIERGFLGGKPGTDESVALARFEWCPLDAAVASAGLLREFSIA